MLAAEYPLWAVYVGEKYGMDTTDHDTPVDAGRVTHTGSGLRIGGTGGRTIRGTENIVNYLMGLAQG